MSNKSKSTHKQAGQATANGKATETNQAAEWAKQMVENLTDAQKKWIEITSEQNALVLKAITEGFNFYKTAPTPALADWARQGIEGFVEAQKRWAEIASEQSKQFFEAMREGAGFDVNDVTRAISDYAGQG